MPPKTPAATDATVAPAPLAPAGARARPFSNNCWCSDKSASACMVQCAGCTTWHHTKCAFLSPWSVPDTFCCVRCTALGVRPHYRPEGEPLTYCAIPTPPSPSSPPSTRSLTIDVPAKGASPRFLDFRIFPASALGDVKPLTTARVLGGAHVRIEYVGNAGARVLFDTRTDHAEQKQMFVLEDALPRAEYRITITPRPGEAGYFCVPFVVHDRWDRRWDTRENLQDVCQQVLHNPRVLQEEVRLFEQTVRGSREGDDEVELVGMATFDLRCPIVLKKMDSPVRSRLCKHLACFDLTAHMLANKRTAFACPRCGARASPEVLVLVPWVRTLLERTGARTVSYVFEPNATLGDFLRKRARDEAEPPPSKALEVVKQ